MHRTLVIGVAGRGVHWTKTIESHPKFQLAGIADLDPQRLAQCGEARKIPPERRCTDYREALKSGNYDAAMVAAATVAHYAITKDVLQAGLHCLVEKPFTLNMAEAVELVELAEKRKLVLEVVQNYRFNGNCRFVEQAVREQRLGRLSCVDGRFHRWRPPRAHETGLPYPLLFVQSVHHLDWLTAILPAPIEKVHVFHRRPPWSAWASPSLCHISIKCADGVLVCYQGSYNTRGDISSYGGRWRFECERGDLVWDEKDAIWEVTDEGKRREKVYEPQPGEKSGDAWLLDTWDQGITQGLEPPTSGRNNLKTLKLLFDIMAADANG